MITLKIFQEGFKEKLQRVLDSAKRMVQMHIVAVNVNFLLLDLENVKKKKCCCLNITKLEF